MNPETVTVDCRGMRCPAPILTLSKATRAPTRPSRLEVLADDGDFPTDLQAWCRSTGAQLTSIREDSGVFFANIEMPGAAPSPTPPGPNREISTLTEPAPAQPELVKVDCSGMRCPAPILAVARATKDAKGPTVLEIRATDGDFPTDLQAWSRSTKNPVIALTVEAGVHVALVGLHGATTAPAQPEPAPVRAPTPISPPPVAAPAPRAHADTSIAALDVRGMLPAVALLAIGQRSMEVGALSFVASPDPQLARQLTAWAAALDVQLTLRNSDGVLHGEVHQAQVMLPDAATVPTAPARAATPEATGLPRENRATLLVLRNDFESLMAAMMVANASAAQGMEVEVYFSFWGVNVLRGDAPRQVVGTELEKPNALKRMMKWMMPAGPDRQQMSKMNFAGAGVGMMKYFMREQNVLGIRELMQQAVDLDVKFVVCTMSMGIMGITKSDLMDLPNLQFGGVTAFSSSARISATSMVF